uniref:Uncharacterized protein n=1 Tax=Arundo donax TaxID=35708 RepID=A0A0A9AV56_ARUDO
MLAVSSTSMREILFNWELDDLLITHISLTSIHTMG